MVPFFSSTFAEILGTLLPGLHYSFAPAFPSTLLIALVMRALLITLARRAIFLYSYQRLFPDSI
jgi:hypothetical protein